MAQMTAPESLTPELQRLEAEALAIEAEAAPPPIDAEGKPAAPVDYLTDARGVMDIAAEALAAFYPSTAPILDDKARGRIAGAMAPVMEKYGLDLAGIFGKWGAEIGLAFALAQVAIPLSKAIQADRHTANVQAAAAVVKAATSAAQNPPIATAAAAPAADLYAKA